MPMYEYRCGACGDSFERYSAGSGGKQKVETCAKCGKQAVKKVFSTFAASCCSSGGGGSAPSLGGCGGGGGFT